METLHKTVTTPEGDGIITWVEDNDVAVLLDDGKEYIFDQSAVHESTSTTANIRRSYWDAAHRAEDDFFDACNLYIRIIRKWNRLVSNAGKTCSKCGQFKHFKAFHNSQQSQDGLRPDCKECRLAEAGRIN